MTLEDTKIVKKMKEAMEEKILDTKITRPRRIFIHVNKTSFKNVILYLIKELDFTHLSTITGVDCGEKIEVIYHLSHKGRTELSLKVRTQKKKPVLPLRLR